MRKKKRSLSLHIQASCPACSLFKHIPSTGRILCNGDHPDGYPTPWPRKLSLPRRTYLNTQLHQETIVDSRQSTYFPWPNGPQNCPGARFAHVEFIAVLACLLRDHRIGIIKEPGETTKGAAKRALATTEDYDLELLLRMRNADKIRLERRRV